MKRGYKEVTVYDTLVRGCGETKGEIFEAKYVYRDDERNIKDISYKFATDKQVGRCRELINQTKFISILSNYREIEIDHKYEIHEITKKEIEERVSILPNEYRFNLSKQGEFVVKIGNTQSIMYRWEVVSTRRLALSIYKVNKRKNTFEWLGDVSTKVSASYISKLDREDWRVKESNKINSLIGIEGRKGSGYYDCTIAKNVGLFIDLGKYKKEFYEKVNKLNKIVEEKDVVDELYKAVEVYLAINDRYK